MTAVTLREARTTFFESLGAGDGGYHDKWVRLKIGPVPFAIPNTKGRVRAVRLHDLHHIVTGYGTDWRGEFEISAFEVGSGCRDYWAAWVLNLSGMASGLVVAPWRTFTAFVRGRRSRNLYHEGYSEALLEEPVDEVRRRMIDDAPTPTSLSDAAAFVGFTTLGIAVGTATFIAPIVATLLVPAWVFLS